MSRVSVPLHCYYSWSVFFVSLGTICRDTQFYYLSSFVFHLNWVVYCKNCAIIWVDLQGSDSGAPLESTVGHVCVSTLSHLFIYLECDRLKECLAKLCSVVCRVMLVVERTTMVLPSNIRQLSTGASNVALIYIHRIIIMAKLSSGFIFCWLVYKCFHLCLCPHLCFRPCFSSSSFFFDPRLQLFLLSHRLFIGRATTTGFSLVVAPALHAAP